MDHPISLDYFLCSFDALIGRIHAVEVAE